MMIDVRELRIQLDDLYRQCVEKKPAFDALVTRLAEQTGSKTLLVPLKEADRALEKAVSSLGGKLDGLTDVLRATLIFEKTEDVVAAHNWLLKQLPVLRERNLYQDEISVSDGYRDAKIDFYFDGIPVELQLNTQNMLAAKEKAHGLYEEKRQLLAGKRTNNTVIDRPKAPNARLGPSDAYDLPRGRMICLLLSSLIFPLMHSKNRM